MPKRFLDYETGLIERLRKDPEFAAEYLNASIEDDSETAEQVFLIALQRVAKAYGMTRLAQKSGMARQAIYRALSKTGNPELSSLKALLGAMGLSLAIKQKSKTS